MPGGGELTRPREFVDNGTKVDIYQPQIEQWEGTNFQTRFRRGHHPGRARTRRFTECFGYYRPGRSVDKSARIVTLNDIQ